MVKIFPGVKMARYETVVYLSTACTYLQVEIMNRIYTVCVYPFHVEF